MKTALLATLAVIGGAYILYWWRLELAARVADGRGAALPTIGNLLVGFGTDFLDTLGIGSFATTTSAFKFSGQVSDEAIPGTMNVGHAIPTIAEAVLYISIVNVHVWTLIAMITASVAGAWFGAGYVSRWRKRTIQIGMGCALIAAGLLMVVAQAGWLPAGGTALGLSRTGLLIGVMGNLTFGALMTLGIGLYAPCMILVSLLGMDPTAAFPIMTGSCAFLMPIGSLRFIHRRRYDARAAVGLSLGGIPGVLVAAFIVKSLPLSVVRWLVIGVVIYTAAAMLAASQQEQGKSAGVAVAS